MSRQEFAETIRRGVMEPVTSTDLVGPHADWIEEIAGRLESV